MLQKDYILKLIEEASKVLAVALKLIKSGDLVQAEKEVAQAYNGLLKTNRQKWIESSDADLNQWLSELEPTKSKTVGDLFFADAKLFEALIERENAKHFAHLALNAFDYYEKMTATFDFEVERKKRELKAILNQI